MNKSSLKLIDNSSKFRPTSHRSNKATLPVIRWYQIEFKRLRATQLNRVNNIREAEEQCLLKLQAILKLLPESEIDMVINGILLVCNCNRLRGLQNVAGLGEKTGINHAEQE